jgi:anti-sigma28 factor (negative regulator of flagellin synthesis)
MTDQWRYSPDTLFRNPNDSGTFCIDPSLAKEKKEQDDEQLMERWLNKLKRMPKVRMDRIREIKEEIDNGTYYSDQKWEAACEALKDDLQN